jgi:hypothetical protein
MLSKCAELFKHWKAQMTFKNFGLTAKPLSYKSLFSEDFCVCQFQKWTTKETKYCSKWQQVTPGYLGDGYDCVYKL